MLLRDLFRLGEYSGEDTEPVPTGSDKILRGVYPEPNDEILHFVQNDKRRAQNDKAKD
jgi:hypothetical protein